MFKKIQKKAKNYVGFWEMLNIRLSFRARGLDPKEVFGSTDEYAKIIRAEINAKKLQAKLDGEKFK